MSVALLKKALDNLKVSGHAMRANVIRDYKDHHINSVEDAEQIVIFAMNLDALDNAYLQDKVDPYAYDYLKTL